MMAVLLQGGTEWQTRSLRSVGLLGLQWSHRKVTVTFCREKGELL